MPDNIGHRYSLPKDTTTSELAGLFYTLYPFNAERQVKGNCIYQSYFKVFLCDSSTRPGNRSQDLPIRGESSKPN